MKKLWKILLILIILLAVSGFSIYNYSTNKALTDFKVTYLDEKLPLENGNFKDIKILYFTDLVYGEYFNTTHLEALQQTINTLDFDLFIFGGDLFDKDYAPTNDDIITLTTFFNSINCKLGKFAIYGDYDLISDNRSFLVKKIYNEGQLELINGEHKIYNNDLASFISICGYTYDSEITEIPTSSNYKLAFVHSYKQALDLTNKANLVLLGNSHDFQINYPFKNHQYNLGLNNNLYVVKSIGFNKQAIRLFNSPEIVIINLK